MQYFSDTTRAWFGEAFREPTAVQKRGWQTIATGAHALLIAPTGSGKTLAAFLYAIDRLTRPERAPAAGVRVLYISPLKALVYDVERNLRGPLAGIRVTAGRNDVELPDVRVDVRTGDTPQRERQRQRRDPGEILVTTPESLFLLLGSQARETLRTVETVIVDEVHALAPSKRGVHLALSLERLSALTEEEPQRIGLSATVRPRDAIANFLGGDRPVEIVATEERPGLEISVNVPVPDMQRVTPPEGDRKRGGPILGQLSSSQGGGVTAERGIWTALYPELLETVQQSTSTIIFVNSRGLCERLCQRLNDLAGEELLRAHHGSVSHEKRAEIEDALKRGQLRGIVATSSLELGIDMGAVDKVVMVESPGSVARGLQRAGRAGHRVGEISVARIYPKFRADLLESALIAGRMREGAIESVQTLSNPLDVLAQQIVAMCVDKPRTPGELAAIARRSQPYRELSDDALHALLEMLTGRFPSNDFADLRPRLSWDRAKDLISARRGTAMVTRLNSGTIPDRGNYAVHLGEEGPRIGELDEEMVFETRDGDTILLGSSTWRVEQITRDRVIVSPAPGEPGRLPFWRGEGPGRPYELGQALGALLREVGSLPKEKMTQVLREKLPLDAFAAANLAAYLNEQREQTGTIPSDKAITIERFRDELGDWRVCILTPFGARLHAPWAMALQRTLSAQLGYELQVMYTDDGIVLRIDDTDEPPGAELLIPDPDEIGELVTEQLGNTSLFAGIFRENAVRSLLLTRRGRSRNPLWAQRIKSQNLLAAVRHYPDVPIVLETYRQCLRDIFDMPGLRDLLTRVRAREIALTEVETRSASPFARSLVFAYVAAYLYEGDQPLAERKAQALTLDRQLLADLLGQDSLRELIDPQVLDELEAELQALTADRAARDADELHDMLRRLGDLGEAEAGQRCTSDPAPWLAKLQAQRRAVEITIAGETRWIAAEDAGLYRDALGAMPPAGLPGEYLVQDPAPLERLVRRYARSHGPFLTPGPAQRFGLWPAQIEPALQRLADAQVLVHGEIRPGGAQSDWCDQEILRRLKRRTLAKLRNEVAPVDSRTLALFLPRWHGLDKQRRGPERLAEVVAQLEGLPLSWSALTSAILPARIADFDLDQLDMACANGSIVWVGHSASGVGDGRVALYLRDHVRRLLVPGEPFEPEDPIQATLLACLRQHGASFLSELHDAVDQAHPGSTSDEFRNALWDLVWAGQITNDTFAPLRSLGRRVQGGRRSRFRVAGGRWWCVSDLFDPQLSPTERAVAQTRVLLERYGIVSREAALAEDLPGGFSSVYKVLRQMEESGKARRGYFVEGLSGAQFGFVGAVDRLRSVRAEDAGEPYTADDVLLLSAVDPANPYGSLLPWPVSGAGEKGRPRRVAGAWLISVGGKPVVYVLAGGRQILTFPSMCDEGRDELEVAVQVLGKLPRRGRRRSLIVEKVDGVPVRESQHYDLLLRSGFISDYRGLVPAPAV